MVYCNFLSVNGLMVLILALSFSKVLQSLDVLRKVSLVIEVD